MKYLKILLPLALMVGLAACVKTEFDEPPLGGEPINITANATIKALKALHITPGGYDKVVDDMIISGVVVMDDRSGNYYKTLVIQDSTGGIEVKFNDGYLYNQYPVGRRMYIKCQGLILSDYNGLTQLTGSTVEQGGQLSGVGITAAQIRDKVVKGPISDTPPVPRVTTLGAINADMVSTLLQFNDVEFIKADTGKTYADPVTKYNLNRTIEDCNSLQIILRSSGYAEFAGALTPGGKGTITGVLGIYNGTYQFFIRDTYDVQMEGERCGAVPATGLTSLNETFDGTSTNVDVDIIAWTNIAVQGNRIWRGASFSGDKFASATAYNSSLAAMETWLITPPIDLRTQKSLNFQSSSGYYVHDGLSVWVSTDFNGQNPSAATWTQLNFTKPTPNASGYSDFVSSGNIALPVFNGKGWIGFKYSGDTNTNTTTWRFDDVIVQ
ncbi:MAG: choice-of-anchor J domain-containing protein [Lewinellaceae bacterium]|nr:choice-of-anchor J domain-containing protein [Lewinellaceae bacterium]